METQHPTPQDEQRPVIEAILKEAGRIAVVGVSDNPDRPSHRVASYLLAQGLNLSPVNPLFSQIFSTPCFPDLGSIPERIDLVNVFRKSSEAGAVVDAAIAIGARAVWLQEGVIDEDAAARARAAGLLVVMDRCIAVEYARWTTGKPTHP